MCKCDFCGGDYKDRRPNYGKEYGLVRLDNSGDLFVELNLCDSCRDKLIYQIKDMMTES